MQNTLHNTKLYRLPPSVSSSEKSKVNCLKNSKNIREFVMNFNFRVASTRGNRGFECRIFGYDGEDARIAVA